MKDNLKLETVASTNFPALAEVYRSILEDAGFQVFIANEYAPTYVGLANSVLVQVEAWVWVDRLAAVQAKPTISFSSASVKSAGALPRRRNWLMALPPKISPAPVVSTT